MQIKLTESDIRAGIALYLASRGITGVNGAELQVTFTAGRKGGAGLTAEVITEASPVVQVQINDANGVKRLEAELPATQVVVKEKSSADLPAALGGDAQEVKQEAPAETPVEPEAQAPQEPEAPAEEEGKSLFS